MAVSKIAITIDSNLLKEIDMLVKSNLFPSRSKAIQEAVAEKIKKTKKKLDWLKNVLNLIQILNRGWQKRDFQWR